ncbi:MAG TPA: diguanylate cyclase [Pyrinomonadaceae bacterium]|nr:diguanylate cyclase [Pyrinomonadaceae bacterium]
MVKAKLQKKTSVERVSPDQRRVLLINEEANTSLVSLLESSGFKIVGISAGTAAPISLSRSRPHLVIASTSVRGLSILELARMLHQGHDDLPFILFGPEAATAGFRRKAILAGAFDYFQIPAEVELMILRAKQLVALRQKVNQLRGEANLDTLTGLANRRRFRVALSRELERWRRYGAPCALILIDIDHMKKINDTYGHPAGDLVIRELAETLARVCRNNDIAARLGGEEFALLCANLDATKAELAARRLREVLTQLHFEGIGRVTVSIGVAACPEHATSERALYAASDAALYVAKNEGRDRVALAPRLPEELPAMGHRKG